MSDTAMADELKIKTSVEDAGPSRKKLNIEIPAEEVQAKMGDSLDTILAEAELPGFRKGRAPKRLVEKKFGSTIREEAKKQLVAMAYQQAVKEHELKVISEPTSESLETAEVEAGKPLAFDVEVEVVPAFDMPKLEGIKVRKPTFEVTDDLLKTELDKLCVNEGELEERDAPEAGDYLTGHGVMTGPDGDEFYNIEGAVVRVPLAEDNGRGMILGVMVDDFETQLGKPKAGETATIKTKGPDNHEKEELRGKDLTVTFNVTRIDRIIPAELSKLVQAFGMESEDQLKEAVKTRLNQRGLVNQQAVMRQQIAKHLLDNVEMELPERMTAAQAGRNLERRRMELMYRGVDQMEIEKQIAELRAASSESAARELKLFFILHHAAEDLEVGITEAEVNGRIAQLAMERGQRPEDLRRELIQSGQVNAVAQQIREHKTIDAILAKAEVEELPAEEFNKVMQEELGDSA